MADSVRRAGHRVRRRRLQGRARAEVQLRLRRLPRHRSRQLPEGGLLEGGAARRPRAGAAEERLAVRRADPAPRGARHASYVLQGGTQYNLAAVKAQVDYIKERVPGARGLRPPAHRRGRRDRRRDGDAARRQAQGQSRRSSASMRRSPSSTRRRTTKRPSVTSARTSASARSSTRSAPTARPAATSPASPARRAPSRAKEAMLALVAERKKIAQQFPNIVDYEAKRAFCTSTTPAPMPADGSPIKDVEVQEGHLRHPARRDHAARSSARRKEALEKRRRVRIGIPRVLNIYSTAPCFRTYFEALGIPKQNVVFSDETTEEMWVEGGKYGSIDPCYPSQGRAGAHPQPALPPAHRRRSRSSTSSSRSSRTCRTSSTDTMDNASCPIVAGAPDVMKAAFTKEVDFFATRGIEYLDPALIVRRADAHRAAHVRDLGPAPRHHRGRERPRLPRGAGRRSTIFENDVAGEGARHPRDGRGRGPRRHPAGRRARTTRIRASTTASPRSSRSSAIRSSRCARSRKDREYLDRYFKEELERGIIKTPARAQPRLAGELLGQQRAEGVGARASRRTTRTSSCSISRRFKCGHDAPTYGLIDSIIETSARRRTPRSTTSTRTSRAARSRSASRPTRTRSSSTRSASRTRASASELARARDRQEAPRAPRAQGEAARRAPQSATRRSTRRSRSSRAKLARLRGARRRRRPSRPKGHRAAREEDARTGPSSASQPVTANGKRP